MTIGKYSGRCLSGHDVAINNLRQRSNATAAYVWMHRPVNISAKVLRD
jgi:hypothetical protein